MVTMISQDVSQFALHLRAILGFYVGEIRQHGPSASYVVLGDGHSDAPAFTVESGALMVPDTALRLFGKPEVQGHRRLGVALARGESLEEARQKARTLSAAVRVELA
jgi:phosphoribosylglycinamide formyltransferase 2